MTRDDKLQYVLSRILQTLINPLAIAVPCFAGFYYLFKPKAEAESIIVLILTGLSALILSALLTYYNSRHIIKKLEKKYAKGDSDGVTA